MTEQHTTEVLDRQGKLSKMLYHLEAAREIERTLSPMDQATLEGQGFYGRRKQVEGWLEMYDAGA